MQVVCDGHTLALPDDIEGLLIINIPSYMGGVQLWASSTGSCMPGPTPPQSFSDGMLEVSCCPIRRCLMARKFTTLQLAISLQSACMTLIHDSLTSIARLR